MSTKINRIGIQVSHNELKSLSATPSHSPFSSWLRSDFDLLFCSHRSSSETGGAIPWVNSAESCFLKETFAILLPALICLSPLACQGLLGDVNRKVSLHGAKELLCPSDFIQGVRKCAHFVFEEMTFV